MSPVVGNLAADMIVQHSISTVRSITDFLTKGVEA